jgi:hypothetical protein
MDDGSRLESNWYSVACKKVSGLFITNPGKYQENYNKKEKGIFVRAKERFKKEEKRFLGAEAKYKPSDSGYISALNRFRREEARFERAKKRYKEDSPRRILRFARLDVEPYEVTLFANVVFLGLIILLLVFDAFLVVPIIDTDANDDGFRDNDKNGNNIHDMMEDLEPQYEYSRSTDGGSERFEKVLIGYQGGVSPMKVSIYLVAPTLLIPFAVFYFLATYPTRRANRVKAQNFGRMPEAISYMSISMRLNPSLNKAVEFASDNVEEPLSGDLKQVIWDVYMNKFTSIEESYLDFAYKWGEWNEDFKRSLYAIRSSVLETSQSGIKRVLDSANAIILEGTINQVEGYLNSLSGPTMILFALGVLLPIFIATLLPIMGLGRDYLPLVVLLMDVVFPMVTLLYAMSVLQKRPGTMLPPNIPSPLTKGTKRGLLIFCALLGITLISVGIYSTYYVSRYSSDETSGMIKLLASVPIIWGIGLPLAIYMKLTSRDQKRELELIRNMEEEFPDAMFALGSRIAEGKPYEYAIEKTADSLKGSHISSLFKKISYGVNVSHASLRQVLFGRNGALKEFPSKSINAVMKMVVETSKKDSLTAGQTIIDISTYQRELKRAERRIQNELSRTINTMKTTGMIFAPMIMGVTTALYYMLVKNLSGLDTAGDQGATFGLGFSISMDNPIPPSAFSVIVGIYLILTVIIIGIYTSGIQYGEDWIRRKDFIGTAIPIALVIYTVSLVAANMFIG